jgi:hypothetical protein
VHTETKIKILKSQASWALCGAHLLFHHWDRELKASLGYIVRRCLKQSKTCHAPVAHTVILATQEAEIRRIKIQSQPRQIVHETLTQKSLHQKGLVEWLKV